MDSQQVELVGRQRLIEELLRAGFEVALPMRDRGIDVIAYFDRDESFGRFVAIPIQLKASTKEGWGVERKYARTRDLLLVNVWNVHSPQDLEIYAAWYDEAEAIAEEMGWTKTASWMKSGYATTRPSRRLRKLLEPLRMTTESWRRKIEQRLKSQLEQS